jgi:sporulation protein YlmC with PRC-barrel domain
MKKTFGTIAAAAALMASTVVAPAFAQTNNTGTSPDAPAPAAGGTEIKSMGAPGAYLSEQSPTQISANDYIGQPIYNANNDSIGDVNDLILEENGGIVAAVVGVGGFLGIGEKDVAVPMDKITMSRDAQNNNELRLSTTETAEALQAAPEFKTLDDKQAETDATTTSSTSTPAMGGGAGTVAPTEGTSGTAAPATGGAAGGTTAPQQ